MHNNVKYVIWVWNDRLVGRYDWCEGGVEVIDGIAWPLHWTYISLFYDKSHMIAGHNSQHSLNHEICVYLSLSPSLPLSPSLSLSPHMYDLLSSFFSLYT